MGKAVNRRVVGSAPAWRELAQEPFARRPKFVDPRPPRCTDALDAIALFFSRFLLPSLLYLGLLQANLRPGEKVSAHHRDT